jgi:hypothetical protein
VRERHPGLAFATGDLDRLVVYEWVLDEDGDGAATVALFDLMMLVENEGGAAPTAARLTGWLEAAGLAGAELRRGAGPIAGARARAPQAGRTEGDD